MAGPTALALQFHLEADPHRIEPWLIGHAVEWRQAGVDIASLRRDARLHGPSLAAALAGVLDAWQATW
jgi:GMP synthase (glutamine-hydrolysing)